MAAKTAFTHAAESILSGLAFPHPVVFHNPALTAGQANFLRLLPDLSGNNWFVMVMGQIHFFLTHIRNPTFSNRINRKSLPHQEISGILFIFYYTHHTALQPLYLSLFVVYRMLFLTRFQSGYTRCTCAQNALL